MINKVVEGVVVTGKGNYYSAGVDLSSMIQPMAPSALVKQLRDQNQMVFETFINFPKPIVAAVNGPAIGATVTTSAPFANLISARFPVMPLVLHNMGYSRLRPFRPGGDKSCPCP